jgi:hypothetical protein
MTYWVNNSAVPETTYTYKVKALNECGASGFSGTDSGFRWDTPAVPTGISATDGTRCDCVYVTWNAVQGATLYELFRSPGPGGESGYGSLGTVSTTYWVNNSAVPGTTYKYKVRALNGHCTSGFSSVDSGYRLSCP